MNGCHGFAAIQRHVEPELVPAKSRLALKRSSRTTLTWPRRQPVGDRRPRLPEIAGPEQVRGVVARVMTVERGEGGSGGEMDGSTDST